MNMHHIFDPEKVLKNTKFGHYLHLWVILSYKQNRNTEQPLQNERMGGEIHLYLFLQTRQMHHTCSESVLFQSKIAPLLLAHFFLKRDFVFAHN